MSTSVASVVSHFPDAENGFTTTTAGSVSSGAATVTLNSVAGYTNGEPVVLVIDPTDASKKQTFTGIVDTSGVQITSVVWTAGTNQTHALGATVVDYATATHIAMMSKGIKVEHSQDGTHKAAIITSRTEDTAPDVGADYLLAYDTSATALKKVKPSNLGLTSGWIAGQLPSVSSVTNNGNGSYTVTYASTVAALVSPGQRGRFSRTVAAPTQCADLEAGSSQGFTVTNAVGLATGTTWTFKGSIKPESYAAMVLVSIDDGTNRTELRLNASGQIVVAGGTTAAEDLVTSYQSVVLDKWQEITGSITIGTPTGEIRINDTVVPSFVTGSASTTMTISGDEEIYIGRNAAGNYFDGKIAQVAIFNSIVSDATLKTYSGQTMTGSESGCEGFWSLNGVLTDSSANGNTLVAGGGAAATNSDSPFAKDANGTPGGTYEFGIATKVATADVTYQLPEGCRLPTSGGVSAVDLSSVKSPFGFPAQRERWKVKSIHKLQSSAAASTSFSNIGTLQITVPVGDFETSYQAVIQQNPSASTIADVTITLSTTSTTETDSEFTTQFSVNSASNVSGAGAMASRTKGLALSSATLYYLNLKSGNTSGSVFLRGDTSTTVISAEPAHL